MATRQTPRRKASEADYLRVLHEVLDELRQATVRFAPMNSLHEGYAVTLEELEEAWEEIKRNPALRDDPKVRAELIQVAAMAVRTVVDCLGHVLTDHEAVMKRQARMKSDREIQADIDRRGLPFPGMH